MTIEVTEKAKAEFTKLGVPEGSFLRIAVVEGGCAGMKYTADVESEMKEGDELIFEDGNLRIVADIGSAIYLDGLKIDYSDDLVKSGFRFLNPSAAGSCGCGASFAS